MSENELRVSDAEREQAVARLRDASAEGRLTLEELVERTGTAYVARTHGELVELTADLPAPKPASAPPRTSRTRFVVAIFAPVRRRNRWKLGRHTYVFSLFAPTFFELGEANLEEDEAVITVLAVCAPGNITVPPAVDLDTSVLTILAPFHERGEMDQPSPAAPRIRVRGLALCAPVFVRYARSYPQP